MSKVYPKHGSKVGGDSGERIRSTYNARPSARQGARPTARQSARPQQTTQQPPPRQHQQQQQQSYQQRSSRQPQMDDYWPSLFTILCSIPVILILYHYLCKLLSKIIWGSLTITVEVSGPRLDHPKKDEETPYQWLLNWMAKNLKNLQNTTVQLNKKTGRLVRYPGFGITHFQYQGAWVKLERVPTPEIRCNDIPYEKMILSFVSSRSNRTLLYELLEESRPTSKKKVENQDRTNIYNVDQTSLCWKASGTRGKKQRPLQTVICADDTKQKLLKDVQEFLGAQEWYAERGIPYRRGYLLYGPPGCGKTSLVEGIAGELGYDISNVPLSSTKLTDETLGALMNATPDNCVILLEDVDEVVRSYSKSFSTNDENPCQITLGGLLNALDGVAAAEDGRIVFMTTNQVEKLDPALTRPGRVDMKVFLGFPNDDQLKQLYARFYPESGIKIKAEFVRRVRELAINVTMAQIQGLFMFCKKDGVDAMNYLQEYFQDQFLISELEPNK